MNPEGPGFADDVLDQCTGNALLPMNGRDGDLFDFAGPSCETARVLGALAHDHDHVPHRLVTQAREIRAGIRVRQSGSERLGHGIDLEGSKVAGQCLDVEVVNETAEVRQDGYVSLVRRTNV